MKLNVYLKKYIDGLKENFLGVFPSGKINKFIMFERIMMPGNKYPFIISNTDRSDKNGNIGGVF